jgi:hypothetical protein
MKFQTVCERYAAFRQNLGERFEVNGRKLKAFCRAMGPHIDIVDVSPENVNTFQVGAQLKSLVTQICPFVNPPETRRSRFAEELNAEKMKKAVWLRRSRRSD